MNCRTWVHHLTILSAWRICWRWHKLMVHPQMNTRVCLYRLKIQRSSDISMLLFLRTHRSVSVDFSVSVISVNTTVVTSQELKNTFEFLFHLLTQGHEAQISSSPFSLLSRHVKLVKCACFWTAVSNASIIHSGETASTPFSGPTHELTDAYDWLLLLWLTG